MPRRSCPYRQVKTDTSSKGDPFASARTSQLAVPRGFVLLHWSCPSCGTHCSCRHPSQHSADLSLSRMRADPSLGVCSICDPSWVASLVSTSPSQGPLCGPEPEVDRD